MKLIKTILLGALMGLTIVSIAATSTAKTVPAASLTKAKPAVVKTVNVNTATVKQLAAVKGISKTQAKAIVKYRKKNGNFKVVSDLAKVKGMNQQTVDSITDKLSVK